MGEGGARVPKAPPKYATENQPVNTSEIVSASIPSKKQNNKNLLCNTTNLKNYIKKAVVVVIIYCYTVATEPVPASTLKEPVLGGLTVKDGAF